MSGLRHQFLHSHNFELAWDKVATNQGCAGVDGETITDFGHRKAQALPSLRQAVAQGRYRPMPLRQLFVPKPQGGWRELRVPTVRDRIVQQALLQVLHPVLDPHFEPSSFAYRPGRSHLMAVDQVAHWRDRGYDQMLDADIVKYFDNIGHGRLMDEVAERIDQPWLLALLQSWLAVGVLTKAGILLPQRGVAQGAVISPMLANVYLDDLDEALDQPGWKLVRYADDFVLLARSQQRLLEGKAEVSRLLAEFDLQLHPEKTRITTFDKGFRFLGHVFAGEVITSLTKPALPEPGAIDPNPGVRLVYADREVQPTAMQLALVAGLKVSQKPIPPPLFVVLGYQVRREKPVTIESAEVEWSNGMSSLYVVQQGTYLKKEQGRFILKPPKDETLEVPIQEVERILVFGNVQISTAVISTCLEAQIPVIFLSQLGEYKGHLWSAESGDLVLETAQFDRQREPEFQAAMARAFVKGKVTNSKQLLLRLRREEGIPEVVAALARLDDVLQSLQSLGKSLALEQIRGYEGLAAAQYFAALDKLIRNPGFSLPRRAFHPPPDPMNSLLSFGYTLLFNNVFSVLLSQGLNPYLGHLHGAERPKAYLAFDLMEEFRSPIVDTLVMKLVNQKVIRPTDFTWPTETGGVYLEGTARRVFLKRFEDRMNETASHPDVQESVTYRRIIELQVQRYIRALLGNQPYEPFRRVI
jgi:CRISPR-associated protein Cas1